MRKIKLTDMIHAESVELLKRTCHHCNRDYLEHDVGDINGYHYPFCPSNYGHTFVSQLLMLGDAFLLEESIEFDSIERQG